ncbi:MAG: acylphosphatase, partial [Candidatus Sumerlaeota bacterium]|nr:acylphosphatase [Candidatus Sumerlaeota bacterium]
MRIQVQGLAQGVGFRPFVYNLAARLALAGWARNNAHGIEIELEGAPAAVDGFLSELRSNPPPLSIITRITTLSDTVCEAPTVAAEEGGDQSIQPPKTEIPDSQSENRKPETENQPSATAPIFQICASECKQEARSALISPDYATCHDCLRELFDPADRRYRFPFINCTNCGPRFTIIHDLPYDRARTAMSVFPMCPACQAEYENPAHRRFHAEPTCCETCGPHVWLTAPDGKEIA